MRLFPELTLTAVVAGVGLGIWLNLALPSAWPLLALGLAILAAVLAMRLLRLPAGPVALAGILLLGAWRGETAAPPALPIVPVGSDVGVTVLVTDAPTVSGSRVRFRGRVVAAGAATPGSVPTATNLLVYALPPAELVSLRPRPYLRYGDTLRLSGRLERPKPIGDFDYAAWLESQQIAAVMWAREAELVDVGGGNKLAAATHRIRGRLASGLHRGIPAPQSGLAQALLLGIRSELPEPVKEAFRTAGMSHLLAISGLHVGIVLAMALAVSSATLGRNSAAAIVIAALAVWAYAALSGLDPPVVRAAIMGSLMLAQGLTGRGMRGITALLLAAGLMVCIQPALLASLSFQLSFTAMAGVIVGLPIIAMLTGAVSPLATPASSWPARWGQYGLTLLMASAVISTTTTLATLPLIAYHFGDIPLMTVLATMLAMPAMPAGLLGALATALAGLVIAPLATALGTLTWAPLAWLVWVAEAMPPALLSAAWLTPPAMIAWYAVLGLLTLLVSSRWARRAASAWRRRPRWRPAGTTALLAGAVPVAAIVVLLLVGQSAATKSDGLLHLYVLDVGQGDAILVITPEGRRMLIDGGPDPEAALSSLGRLLPTGTRTLDVAAATHLDSDHVGGLIGVLDRYGAGVVVQSANAADAALFPQWRAILARHGHRTAQVWAGHRIELDNDVALDVLYPPREGPPPGVASSANNASAVMRLTYGEVSFLLTGDIERDAEAYLIAAAGGELRSDVLKVAHHGSGTSTSAAFLRAVNPQSAAVSAGADNRYGHPHPEVMARLESAVGVGRVFLTARDGTIEYVSDGVSLWVKTHGPAAR